MEWMDAICIQMGLGLDLVNKLRFTSNSWSRSAVVSLLGDDDDLSPWVCKYPNMCMQNEVETLFMEY